MKSHGKQLRIVCESGEGGARARVDDAHSCVTCKQDEVTAGGYFEVVTRFLDDQ